jgi:catechol 2,3-dioxygenase-like lactoylglutathione lyase family enzyme
MITALAQISIGVSDIESATAAMSRLFAREPSLGEEDAVFQLANTRLALTMSEQGDGLSAITFEVDDATKAFRAAERRALAPQQPVAFAESDTDGAIREGHAIDLDVAATFGVPLKLVHYAKNQSPLSPQTSESAITGLDHIVIRTTHPSRAAALYGARLGLDMRLDRTEPKWGSRFMFFRCADLIVEVVYDLKDEPSDAPDRVWGLSWRTTNADATQSRLKASGLNVSDVRPGRKPGTRVFTVRDNTLGIPTLIVEPSTGRA